MLMTLAGYADKDGFSWPSKATISKDTGYAASTVDAALSSVVAKGQIELVTAGGGRTRNRYRVLSPEQWSMTPPTAEGVPPRQSAPPTVGPPDTREAAPRQLGGSPP